MQVLELTEAGVTEGWWMFPPWWLELGDFGWECLGWFDDGCPGLECLEC